MVRQKDSQRLRVTKKETKMTTPNKIKFRGATYVKADLPYSHGWGKQAIRSQALTEGYDEVSYAIGKALDPSTFKETVDNAIARAEKQVQQALRKGGASVKDWSQFKFSDAQRGEFNRTLSGVLKSAQNKYASAETINFTRILDVYLKQFVKYKLTGSTL